MKPHFHKVPIPIQSSFNVRHDKKPDFGSVWHYHPEFELHYTIKGEGVRLIGDRVESFSDGDIVLLGENLPHLWNCKEEYFEENPNQGIEAIVIHFLPNFMGNEFLSLPESQSLLELYERAKGGLSITGKTRKRLIRLMMDATHAEGFDRITVLMNILNLLIQTKEYQSITTTYTFYQSDKFEEERLNRVCDYTISNYNEPITLQEIARISNLAETSFCRYFKKMTNKTYYDFLTEIRISHACRFLVSNSQMAIEQIAFKCGFSTVSNFYKQFKKITGMTPLTYRQVYLNFE